MREFELVVDEALVNGLSPFDHVRFNVQYLQQALGFRCGEGMIELYETLENPLPAATQLYYEWPFPQFIAGEGYNLLIVRDATINHEDVVYVVSDDMQTVTFAFGIDVLTFGQGTLMEVADFGEYLMAVNGVARVYWHHVGAWTASQETDEIPLMRTICNFKGRAVGGGVTSTWHDCDEKYYIWSKIGEMDFTPDNRNTAGYRRCPYGGDVYHTRRLRDAVIGYSSKGIVRMNPVIDPAPTFRFDELDDVGLVNQGAMNGSLNEQVYVGEDYRVRKITAEGIEKLGYKSFMDELSGEDIVVSYDKGNKSYYIGNSTKTFLLTKTGMTEVPQHPSCVWRVSGESYMLPDAVDEDDYEIATQPFDMGYKGDKTIFSMESDILLADNVRFAVDYYNNPTTYGTSNYIPMNNQGIASIIASGNAFALRLKFEPTYDNTRIGYIKARYKMTDLRGIRGVYAAPPRGQ